MGFSLKFNWVLQIDTPESLSCGAVFPFQKQGNRILPVDTPIDLIDPDRNAIARIKITSFTNSLDATTGYFEVMKLYSGNEKAVLTRYWIENEASN